MTKRFPSNVFFALADTLRKTSPTIIQNIQGAQAFPVSDVSVQKPLAPTAPRLVFQSLRLMDQPSWPSSLALPLIAQKFEVFCQNQALKIIQQYSDRETLEKYRRLIRGEDWLPGSTRLFHQPENLRFPCQYSQKNQAAWCRLKPSAYLGKTRLGEDSGLGHRVFVAHCSRQWTLGPFRISRPHILMRRLKKQLPQLQKQLMPWQTGVINCLLKPPQQAQKLGQQNMVLGWHAWVPGEKRCVKKKLLQFEQ